MSDFIKSTDVSFDGHLLKWNYCVVLNHCQMAMLFLDGDIILGYVLSGMWLNVIEGWDADVSDRNGFSADKIRL